MNKLKDLGLTDQQITTIKLKLGATSVADLAYLQESDLTGIGVPVLKARRVVAEFAPKPAINLGQLKLVWQMLAPELFDVIIDDSADQGLRDDAATEWDSKAGGCAAVVLVDGKPAKYLSLACLEHVRIHRSVQYWGEKDYPVVTARQSLAKKVLRDPLTGDVLVDGMNSSTLTNWKGVSVERLALASWAQGQGLLRDINHREVAMALKAEQLDDFWSRVQTRFETFCQQNPGTKEQIVNALTAAPDARLHPGSFVVGFVDPPSGPTTSSVSGGAHQDVMSPDYQRALRKMLATHCVMQFGLIIRDAGLRSERINLQGGPEVAAKEIVDEARNQGRAVMYRLIAQVMDRCPGYFPLQC